MISPFAIHYKSICYWFDVNKAGTDYILWSAEYTANLRMFVHIQKYT